MTLPDLIEIVPLSAAPNCKVVVPGSKSITNRALMLATLRDGRTMLEGALWSDDTQVMVDALGVLGVAVAVEADAAEPSNRTITVAGTNGRLAPGGTAEKPLEIYVGNAGTAARFLAALVCLGEGVYLLQGTPRMHERPQAELFAAIRQLGYRIDAPANRLPALIEGSGPRAAACVVTADESSQFASALLLAAGRGRWQVEVRGGDADELPYVEMTRRMVAEFARATGDFTYSIEPDASGASYFAGADALFGDHLTPAGRISVANWPASGMQIDADLPRYLPPPAELSRVTHLGDAIMTAIVLAPFAGQPVLFTDLGRLRKQECERVIALRAELTKCGANIVESGDTLTVTPGPLHAAEIETYDDHRMAMCFAMLGLRVPGIAIQSPRCVAKTFPSFFAKLAASPPHGLGATILDAATGRPVNSPVM